MLLSRKERRKLTLGLGFLAPNIVGFVALTIFPLFFSLVMAFSNWDLQRHNIFKTEPLRLIGFANFVRLLHEHDFARFLGNTLFLMIGIPFSIAGSLFLAILLTRDLRGGSRKAFLGLLAGALLVVSLVMLTVVGAHETAMVLLLGSVAGAILLLGVAGGSTLYRTLFYTPHFTGGVATYILWKKLYNPHTGPINTVLAGPLESLTRTVVEAPPELFRLGLWAGLLLLAGLLAVGLRGLRRMWLDGYLGWLAALLPGLLLWLPIALAFRWSPDRRAAVLLALVALVVTVHQSALSRARPPVFAREAAHGAGTGVMLAVALMVVQFVVLGLALVTSRLPDMAAAGLEPPDWLTNYHWAKPAIMLMGFWGSIGSNNMLLYIAGLSNVPTELYEAAAIDGATGFQRFWHVTWPQLAPVTFYIVVMSVIGGLQGGFEMARTMTRGGPAGATTTLSYFIYTEGFETGRLGYSSAIAWMLFVMVFVATMFNWRFGSQYVNE